MNRALLAPFVVAVLSSSCAASQQPAVTAPGLETKARAAGPAKRAEPAQRAPRTDRKVGDFFVHRYSGTAFDTPLVLSEEVKARDESAWIVEYSLTEGESVTKLRVHLDAKNDRPLRVIGVNGDVETELPVDAYDALLERTAFAADLNEGLIDRAKGTCVVGPDELECETKSYRVWISDSEAKLSVTDSKRFAGRDIAGEITAPDGTVIYRAELIDAGNAPSGARSLASAK